MDASTSQPTSATSAEQKKSFLLERIIEASSRNAFLIIILVIFGIAGGIRALTKTPPGQHRAKVKPDMAGDWMATLHYDCPRGSGSVSEGA